MGFIGTSNFTNNSADNGGTIGTVRNVVLTFNGTSSFINNSANSDGGAIYAQVNVLLHITGTSSFQSNSAIQGGAISANINGTLIFNGSIKFANNGHNTDKLRDSHGGALHLAISSTFSILPHTMICWENSHAILGGALYVLNVNPFVYCAMDQVSILKKNASFNSQVRHHPIVLMPNLFLKTTPLVMQEVCYMVVQ